MFYEKNKIGEDGKVELVTAETQKYDIIPYICKYITIFHNVHENDIELSLFTNNLYKLLL